MVIQQSMARIASISFGSAATPLANPVTFFQTLGRIQPPRTLPLQKKKLGTKTGPHGGKQTHRTRLRAPVLYYIFEHNQH